METTEIRQHYFEQENNQFVDNGHYLGSNLNFAGKDKLDERMDNLILKIAGMYHKVDLLLGETVEDVNLREVYDSMRFGVVYFFAEVLTVEEAERFLEFTEKYWVFIYRNSKPNLDGTYNINPGKSMAFTHGLKEPLIYLNLDSVERLKRQLEENIMTIRLEGEYFTEAEMSQLNDIFIRRQIRDSIAHELIHWLLAITGTQMDDHEKLEPEIESFAHWIVETREKVKEQPTAEILESFLGKRGL